jgi:hypothetical protein
MCGIIEGSEVHHTGTSGPSITSHGNFWILNYTTWELLKPQLHHLGTSGPSITPHANFWTFMVQKFTCGVIEGPEVPMWSN